MVFKHLMALSVTGEEETPPLDPCPRQGLAYCKASTATSLEKKGELHPPFPANTRTHGTCPHTHPPTAARACLPDLPPSFTHPLACATLFSQVSSACQSASEAPPSPPQELRAHRCRRHQSIVLLARDGRRQHHCRCSAARSLPINPPASPLQTHTYAIPWHGMAWHGMPYMCHTIPRHTIPYHTIPYHAMP